MPWQDRKERFGFGRRDVKKSVTIEADVDPIGPAKRNFPNFAHKRATVRISRTRRAD